MTLNEIKALALNQFNNKRPLILKFIKDNKVGLLFCLYLGFLTHYVCQTIEANTFNYTHDLVEISQQISSLDSGIHNVEREVSSLESSQNARPTKPFVDAFTGEVVK